MKTKITSLITAGMLGATMASQAAVVTVPTVLNPGDTYRLVFLTSTTTVATSTSISTYNTFVNAAADLNSDLDAISWTAMGSTATVNVRDNTGTTGAGTSIAIYTVTGNLVANDYTDLWDGFIANEITVDEFGADNSVTSAWTGSNGIGTTSSNSLGEDTARAGNPTREDQEGWWMNRVGSANTLEKPMYAMSEVLTVAVPEPSSAALLGLGGFALIFRRRK